MSAQLKPISGAGNHKDRAAELAREICDLVLERGEGMTFAAVIGCLEIVKMQMFEEAGKA